MKIRYHIVIFLILSLITTQCMSQASSINTNQELPNDSLINEVISTVIILDSINNSNLGLNRLKIPIIYFSSLKDDDAEPSPLPYDYCYDDIMLYFNPKNDSQQWINDSIFITRQIDKTRKHDIYNEVESLFLKENDYEYYFCLPIFSYDKKTVLVAYNQDDYFGYLTILRKVDNIWIRISRQPTWMK